MDNVRKILIGGLFDDDIRWCKQLTTAHDVDEMEQSDTMNRSIICIYIHIDIRVCL